MAISEETDQVNVQLGFKLNDGKVLAAEVAKEKFTIGRSARCDVVIPNEGLSREHCLVEIESGEIFITDLGSANGVLIDEERITPNQKTSYNLSFTLSLGSIEVPKFVIKAPVDLLEVDYGESSSGLSSPSQAAPQAGARSSRPARVKGESSGSSAAVHPGLQGMVLVGILAIGFFLFKKVTSESTSDSDQYSLMQHESKMKNKMDDGSVRTRNF